MENKKELKPKWRQPLQPLSVEREMRLKQTDLKMFRLLLDKPDMTIEEMQEMNNKEPDNEVKVTFIKKQ